MVIAVGSHLFPFRTEKLSPTAPMVLHTRGSVGRRHFTTSLETRKRLGALFFQKPFLIREADFPSLVPSQVLDQAKACLEAPATPHNYRIRVAELLPRLSLQLRGVSREKPDLFHSDATVEISCLGLLFSASSLSETVNQLSKWRQSLT